MIQRNGCLSCNFIWLNAQSKRKPNDACVFVCWTTTPLDDDDDNNDDEEAGNSIKNSQRSRAALSDGERQNLAKLYRIFFELAKRGQTSNIYECGIAPLMFANTHIEIIEALSIRILASCVPINVSKHFRINESLELNYDIGCFIYVSNSDFI